MYEEKVEKFIKKWDWKDMGDWTVVSPEFKSFARGFKALMKAIWEIDNKSFKAWHFYTSWFIKVWDHYIYVSISDVRYFKDGWKTNVLYRTAKDTSDYTWGRNHDSSLVDLKKNIDELV